MIPVKIQVPDSFLAEEIRLGYKIDSKMKELWLTELDLLRELLTVCERNKITVFAGYGTLLGAVRHHGFIPWDDDIDLLMKREDYDRFCQIADFKAPYFLQTEITDIGFSRAFARLRNSDTTAIQAYEKDLNILYNQGVFIDIFPIDYMPEDEAKRKAIGRKMLQYRDKAIKWSAYTFRSAKGFVHSPKGLVKAVLTAVMRPVARLFRIHNPYIKIITGLESNQAKTGIIGGYWFYNPDKDNCYNVEDFESVIMLPFEMLEIPVPAGYERILEKQFEDWKTPVMRDNFHGELIVDTHRSYRQYMKQRKE